MKIIFDTHTGDGLKKILSSWPGAQICNPFAQESKAYLLEVETRLNEIEETQMLAVSAGFDGYRLDVGHKLDTEDFEQVGRLVKKASERLCKGRRFAVLEGGYYLPDLGTNVLAFCRGFAG